MIIYNPSVSQATALHMFCTQIFCPLAMVTPTPDIACEEHPTLLAIEQFMKLWVLPKSTRIITLVFLIFPCNLMVCVSQYQAWHEEI